MCNHHVIVISFLQPGGGSLLPTLLQHYCSSRKPMLMFSAICVVHQHSSPPQSMCSENTLFHETAFTMSSGGSTLLHTKSDQTTSRDHINQHVTAMLTSLKTLVKTRQCQQSGPVCSYSGVASMKQVNISRSLHHNAHAHKSILPRTCNWYHSSGYNICSKHQRKPLQLIISYFTPLGIPRVCSFKILQN